MQAALFIGISVLLGLAAFVLVERRTNARERASKANGSFALSFVVVQDDGSIRDLTAEEHQYLNTQFDPGDGARPYIKPSYDSKTPDGRIGGFLLRRRLPKKLREQSP